MYRLIAMNDQGANVTVKGDTIKAALSKFDAEYHRSGWQIHIEREGEIVREIRKSFRKSKYHGLHNGHKKEQRGN
jgi:hypothetical protein